MANYYYSGQGTFLAAERNGTTGAPLGFTELGNVPSMELSIEVTKYEHKESESGSRAVDLSIIQEKKGTFSMVLESLDPFNLAIALWGAKAAVTGAAITDEQVPLWHDKWMPLAHPKISALVVGDDAVPTTTYTLGTDYLVNLDAGAIMALSTGTITDGQVCFMDYTHASYVRTDAFTLTSMERWLRFEGLNTIDNKEVIIDLFKCQIDPLQGYGVINEEIGQLTLNGSVLYDSLRSSGSNFFQQINIT